MAIRGRVWKYGDDVNTDVIYPGKYTYTISDPNEMAQHALEDMDPAFVKEVKSGDVVVAGKNFGCGSSREQAATCLKYAGVGAVVAKSFARIFFRNAINQGLALVECPEVVDVAQKGDEVEIDFASGKVRCRGKEFSFPPLPPEVIGIVEAGGLIAYTRKQLGIEGKGEG